MQPHKMLTVSFQAYHAFVLYNKYNNNLKIFHIKDHVGWEQDGSSSVLF